MYNEDKYILKQLNKYIMMDESEAEQNEKIMIGLIQKYQLESQKMTFNDTTIIKYFLMYLRKVKKEIMSRTWISILEGNNISYNFINFLKENNAWTDYTAQLLCISDKEHIRTFKNESLKECFNFPTDWLYDESYDNIEYQEGWEEYHSKSIKEIVISYEWDNLRNTPEWDRVDISTFKNSDNLTGIALMKYLDSKITKHHIIGRLFECFDVDEGYDEIKWRYYEVYLDEQNKPKIRSTYNPKLLKAKQFDDRALYYVFEEDGDKEQSFQLLTPIDLKIVTISKEYNIKKLVIETKEGHTIHLLYDELPAQISREVYKYNLIGISNEEEKILRKRILNNYKVYVEIDKYTNTIFKNPFLVVNKDTVSLEKIQNTKEFSDYSSKYINIENMEFYSYFIYKIDDIRYDKNNKQTELIIHLNSEQKQKIKEKTSAPNFVTFGKLQLKNNDLILTIKDLSVALPYNVIAKSDGSNNTFELLKEKNYIKLVINKDYDTDSSDDEEATNIINLVYQQLLF